MKFVRFYEEFGTKSNKRKHITSGTVVAVIPENHFWDGDAYVYEAVGAVHDYPNSPVASTSVSPDYLADTCKRITEFRARLIHPELFKYLDRSDS